MDYIEVKAKTIDDAITDALVQLGITSDQLDYEVIEKGSAGILGLGRKDAVIKARKKVVVPEKKPEPVVEKKAEAPVPKKEEAPEVKVEKAPAKAAGRSRCSWWVSASPSAPPDAACPF